MKILFISSGNAKNGISPIIKNQGQSLIDLGHQVVFYGIKGKGIKGYFSNIFKLKKFLKNKEFDCIHAHYSLSAMVAALSGAKPLVVSLMGSDVKESRFFKYLIIFFNSFFWKKVIVKSKDMQKASGLDEVYVIPNGVDVKKFKPYTKVEALKITQWNSQKKHILFAANPARFEKNFILAEAAFELLQESEFELHTLVDIPNDLMPYYFNSADVVLLTSLWEGSPNVIKEAMACNSKIVAVDVGDIRKVIADTKGCFVTGFTPQEIADRIQEASSLEQKTTGRDTINHLTSETIAHQLIKVYKSAIS
ncbi:glycosyltransferase family 4 protein [Aquimarina sp. I32.4]|uniref:glycosyltransferase family 4 protein n=1 Tax=Aquimarina sp. I32.4 TaxID=2053903 RepID=UPI000CDE96E3|nr:glycosyltransferase family 4 protein [Aquimarina sp. I32.4]